MDLVIGLCFGFAAAAALAVMWRIAGRLQDEDDASAPLATDEPQ